MVQYHKPNSLDDAIAALQSNGEKSGADRLTILAGATDLYPVETTKQAWFQSTSKAFLDLSGIAVLRGMSEENGWLRIGAMATWSDVIKHSLPPAFDALKQASRQVGGMQIQNRGTLVGNICNASPAADGMPPLLSLDAIVEIQGPQGKRQLPLAEFVFGNRKTALAENELVTALLMKMPAAEETSVFLKLGARSYLVISIASVAANLQLDSNGVIVKARITVGSCSAVPKRLLTLEKNLIGIAANQASSKLKSQMFDGLNPIDDVRATAAYRLDAAKTLVARALDALSVTSRQAA
jgi:CO/xanthine dehydrogenase FAD-binding subunit